MTACVGQCPEVLTDGMLSINCTYSAGHSGQHSFQTTADLPSKIDHPMHYGGDTQYEAIKVIEAWQLGFCLGNAVKYICRAGKKGDALEDLRKARWYLDREISRTEK